MPFKDLRKRREYYRLLMAKRREQQKKELGLTVKPVNPNNVNPKVNPLNVNPFVNPNVIPELEQKIILLTERVNELESKLSQSTQPIKPIERILVKPVKPPTQPISQPIKKEVENSTNSVVKVMPLRFNQETLERVEKFLKNNSIFVSFSHFLRSALLAYKNGLDIQSETASTSNFDLKKSVRMDSELVSLYQQLPSVNRYSTLGQILSAFLRQNKG